MRNTILTHQQIESRITEAFSIAEHCHYTLDKIGTALFPLWQELSSKTAQGRHRYTAYTRGYARGIHTLLFNQLQRHKVEFVYRLRNDVPQINAKAGELFSTAKVSIHRRTEEFYAAGIGMLLNDAYYAHVWIGTDKPTGAWSVPSNLARPNGNLPQNGITRGARHAA